MRASLGLRYAKHACKGRGRGRLPQVSDQWLEERLRRTPLDPEHRFEGRESALKDHEEQAEKVFGVDKWQHFDKPRMEDFVE